MIAADTSVVIDYIQRVDTKQTQALDEAITDDRLWLPPVVVTELYGSQTKHSELWNLFIGDIPLLEIEPGYWDRAGQNRKKLLLLKHKARLGDALIAQSCIDHQTPLLTRDKDFAPYVKHCGLRLVSC